MKFWFLLGGTLIVLGTLLFVITLASVGWDFTALDGNMYEHKTHTFGEDITNISIDTVTADITILPLDEGERLPVPLPVPRPSTPNILQGDPGSQYRQ